MLRHSVQWAPAAVSVAGTGNTTLLDLNVRDLERIVCYISVATQALDAFIISGSAETADQSSPTFFTLYSAASDYTSPSGLLIGASGDLTTIAASGTGWFIMDVRGLAQVRLQASAAADSASVTLKVSGVD